MQIIPCFLYGNSMKIIKNIFKILLFLFALTCSFVLFCAFHPDFTEQVADFLYSDEKTEVAAPVMQETEIVTAPGAEPEETPGSSLPESPPAEYIPPDQEDIRVPENVSGRGGYEPVQDEIQQIEEEEARELEQQTGLGNTGDDLWFDPVFYPYYAMLVEKGQHLYRQIYANACGLNQSFVPVEEVQVDELKDIFAAVFNDHPELFFMETAYYCKYRRNGQCAQIALSYNRLAEDLDAENGQFLARAGEIIAAAQAFSTAYEKEKYVHDTLAGQITYSRTAEMGQSAYSALVNGQTVCAGYARAFQFIMQQLGIPCYYCTGYAGENHAWNIVVLDDGCYNVDLTFADTDDGIIYDYFNKTDDDYSFTHLRREMAVNLPSCNGQLFGNLQE